LINTIDKKIFGVLFFSLLATITGVGIVVPLLPVYARHSGASGIYVGLIFGAFSLSRTFLLPFFGRLSDLKGRKPFILAGLFSYALVSVAFILFSRVGSLIIIRFFQGIASAMIMPVIQAYVGDMTPQGREGSVMGLFNMAMFFGLSLGPVAGGFISDHFSLQAAFACMGLLALVGFGLCLALLPPTHAELALRKGRPPIQWRVIVGDRVIIGLFAFRMAHTACIGIIWGFLPVLADMEFGLSSSQIGILVMLGVFVSGLMQVPMGYLADRTSRKAMMVVGGVLAAGAILSYQWVADYPGLLMTSAVFGLSGIAMPAMMGVAVLKGQQAESMGSVMAVLTVAHSLGMLAGALLAGLMMDWFDLRVAFTMGAGIMLAGTAVFFGSVFGQPIDAHRSVAIKNVKCQNPHIQ
jgi:MFS transporter, DHA1 family, multidrug resistance protein